MKTLAALLACFMLLAIAWRCWSIDHLAAVLFAVSGVFGLLTEAVRITRSWRGAAR